MSDSKWKKSIKSVYQRFCNVSTMHGYTELYSAKTLLFKWIWMIIILGSIVITGYQVNQTVYQYIFQSSFTNIAPATEDDVIYPPLKVCLPHWIMWVDYKKMEEYFPRNATLYSLSYLTDIYNLKAFDIEAARKEFLAGFAKSDFIDLFDYYKHLALPPYTWISFEPFANEISKYKNYISELFYIDWSNTQSEYPILCYTINGTNIKKHISEGYKNLSSEMNAKNHLHFYLNPMTGNNMYSSRVWDFTQQKTIDKYMDVWQTGTGYVVRNELAASKMPYTLLIDGFTDEYASISMDQNIVTFKVKASANTWKSSMSNPCKEGQVITSNKTCQQMCSSKYYAEKITEKAFSNFKDNCSLLLQSFYGKNRKNDLPKLCRNLFRFGENFTLHKGEMSDNWYEESFSDERRAYVASRQNFSQTFLPDCMSNCSTYCENWKFEISKNFISETLFLDTVIHFVFVQVYPQVVVEYPEIGQILVLTEMDSQTWETFVSNVGGLLGIWTGASILSFIQLFYLCCCAAIDEAYTPKWFRLQGGFKTSGAHILQRPKTKISMGNASHVQYIVERPTPLALK